MSDLKRQSDSTTSDPAVSRFFNPAEADPLVPGYRYSQQRSLRVKRTQDEETIEAVHNVAYSPVTQPATAPSPSASADNTKAIVMLSVAVAFSILVVGLGGVARYGQYLESRAYRRAARLEARNERLEAITQLQRSQIEQAQGALCVGQ